MKIIMHKLIILSILCIIGLLLSLILSVNNFVIFGIDIWGFSALLIPASCILTIPLMRNFEAYRVARLIVENKIMSIEAAEINEKSGNAGKCLTRTDRLEVFISCFGILLGSRVIKFNIDGISLKNVEIGKDLICLAYGNKKNTQNIKLIHGIIEKDELQSIIEKFRYETGIIPTIID